jgi:hypothetical protein
VATIEVELGRRRAGALEGKPLDPRVVSWPRRRLRWSSLVAPLLRVDRTGTAGRRRPGLLLRRATASPMASRGVSPAYFSWWASTDGPPNGAHHSSWSSGGGVRRQPDRDARRSIGRASSAGSTPGTGRRLVPHPRRPETRVERSPDHAPITFAVRAGSMSRPLNPLIRDSTRRDHGWPGDPR